MKRGPFLVDTGFLVALVNHADPAHAACTAAWKTVQGPFLSSEGVLVEACWMLRRSFDAITQLNGVVRGAGVIFAAPARWRYDRALELMETYRDVPMDLVDALLVALASEAGIRDVLTLNRRGFAAYRDAKGRAFRALP